MSLDSQRDKIQDLVITYTQDYIQEKHTQNTRERNLGKNKLAKLKAT